MKRMQSALARLAGIVPFLLAAAVGLAIFAPVLSPFSAQLAPDSMPYFRHPMWLRMVEDVLSRGDSMPPSILYWIALPPLVAHEATYLVDSLLLAAAGAMYLRGRGARPCLAWLGGAALGFSGYTFTLVSAGHRGYFHMMACAVFALPLLERIFRRASEPFARRWPAYALLGFALGWGILTQPDVFALVAALASAYALWLTFVPRAVPGREDESRARRAARVWPAFAISIAAFLLAGGGIFHALVTRFIPDRLAQISRDTAAIERQMGASSEGKAADSGSGDSARTPADEAKSRHDAWIFATNWSLPPEDALEFVAPCVRGIETADYPPGRKYPYWGRLGRTDGWESHHTGFPNFRQHTVYLGAAQVFFALFAVAAWLRARKRGTAMDPWLRDVPFWAVAAAVAMVLSFGRYTPVYRLFYSIPGMSLLRAPVKLHHVTEICVALLFGIGLAAAFQSRRPESEDLASRASKAGGPADGSASGRAIAALCAALLPGIALLVASIVVRNGPASLIRNWEAMGYPAGIGKAFLPRMAAALVHGGLMWLAGVAVWLLARRGGTAAKVAAVAAWACIGGDLVAVGRNYINPYDVTAIYRDNPLVAAIEKDPTIPHPHVANFITDPFGSDDPLSHLIYSRGYDVSGRPMIVREAASRLSAKPAVFLDALASDYIFAPEQAVRGLPPDKFGPVARIDVGAMLGAGRPFPAVLLRRREPMPFAAWLPSWKEAPPDSQVDAALRPGWDASRDPLVDAPAPEGAALAEAKAAASAAKVEVASVRMGRKPALDTVVRISSAAPGMLAVRQYIDIPSEATVDGAPAPVHRYNCVWTAVPVPAGDHTVVVRRPRGGYIPLYLSLAGLAAFLATIAFQIRASVAPVAEP